MSQSFSETLFLTNPEGWFEWQILPRGSTPKHMADLMLFSPSQNSQKGSTHLLKLLALKGHKFIKEKL